MNSIRQGYEEYSVEGFYQQFGADYRNPHEKEIEQVLELSRQAWELGFQKVLDLACGSGEVTQTLRKWGMEAVTGIDPYTYLAYEKRTGLQAEQWSFEEIAQGVLADRQYSLIICSFALHLVPESRLPQLAYQLACIAHQLLILTPHKRPVLKAEWGWNFQGEQQINRVRSRLYHSLYCTGVNSTGVTA